MVHGGIVEVHTSWLGRNSSKKEPKKKNCIMVLDTDSKRRHCSILSSVTVCSIRYSLIDKRNILSNYLLLHCLVH